MTFTFSTRLARAVRADRLDAEYYLPRYLEVERELDAIETSPLTRLAVVSDGNHAAISWDFSAVPDGRYRYLRGQDLVGFFLGDRNPVYISKTSFDSMHASRIYAGDVLLTIVGTVGAVSLVSSDSPEMTASCKIAALRANSVRPEYLAAFLASNCGQAQVARLTRGAVQTGLLLADMKHIRVPRLGAIESDIANEVQRAWQLLREARQALRDARAWLASQLGYSPSEPVDEPLGYVASSSSLIARHRWDAEYYAPRFARHLDAVRRLKVVKDLVPVKTLLISITNGHTPLHHDLSVGEVDFVTAENVIDFEIDPGPKKRITMAQHELELKRTALRVGDVLFTIKGRVGDCAPVTHLRRKTNVNQDVAVLRLAHNVHPYFFAGWFNSDLGRPFVRQAVTGAINPFLGLGTLGGLKFPIVEQALANSVGAEIEAQVESAISREAEASNRLRQAIERVDGEVGRLSARPSGGSE